jgi:hypothetical protein
MQDSSFFKLSVALTFFIVVGSTAYLGANHPEDRGSLSSTDPVRPPPLSPPKKAPPRAAISDKFKTLGARKPEFEVEKNSSETETEKTPVKAFERIVFKNDQKSAWATDKEVQNAGYQAWFGGSGKVPGHFAYPRAMVMASNDKLYVVDKSGRLQRYSSDGRLEIVIRTPQIDRGKPTGLGIDRQGRLLVADTHYARVLVYSADLELVWKFGQQGPKPGNFLFVTDVCQAEDGRHFVSDYGDTVARIQIFDKAGKHLLSFGEFGNKPGEFQRPMALSIDEKRQELLVADAVNHRIQIFDLKGQYKRTIGSLGSAPGQLKYPYDVTLDDNGHLWISEFGNHRLQVLNSLTGQSLGCLGKAGRRLGQVAYPWGVCLNSRGRFFFLDSGNDRIYTGLVNTVLKNEDQNSIKRPFTTKEIGED